MSSPHELNHLTAHEFTHIAQFEALYGGGWRSARLVKGLSGLEPLWIMEGMAETVAHHVLREDWSSHDKMILRDAVLYDRLYSFRELQNFSPLYRDIYLGYKQGHSAMDYLVKMEGEEIHIRLLKAMRNNLDPMKAFETAVTQFKGLRDFNIKWEEWVNEKVREDIKGREKAAEKYDFMVSDEYESRNPVSAGRESFYYVSDRWGKTEIYYYSRGESRKIVPRFFVGGADNLITGHRIYDRIIDYSPETGLLVFAARRNQRPFIYLYDSNSSGLTRIDMKEEELRSPSISPDGNLICFTARDGFKRNIFIYDRKSKKTFPVTDDSYPDFGPSFSPCGKFIVAASERGMKKDIRRIEISSGEIKWLTRTPHNDFHPSYLKGGALIFSSDRCGVNNIYIMETPDSQVYRLTNIRGGAFYPEDGGGGNINLSFYYDGSHKIGRIRTADKRSAEDLYQKPRESHEIEMELLKEGEIKTREASGRFSTDLFLPSFLYATDIGFLGGGVIRMSDYFAHNTLEAYGWGWPGSYEAAFQYINKKFRQDIFLSLTADSREFKKRGEDDLFRRRRYSATAGYTHPLTRYTAFSNYFRASTREEENLDEGETTSYRSDTGTGFIIERNTTILEPFNAMRGYRLAAGAYLARPLEKDGLDYNQYSLTGAAYTPLLRNLVLARRAGFFRSEGRDKGRFGLGGSSLRGYSRNSFRGNNAAYFGAEIRALLFPRLNWHMTFMWPDLNIYSLSAKLFTDAGTAFNDDDLPENPEDWGASWGVGFKLNFYLLQLSPGFISVELAAPYEDMESWRTYLTVTAGHIQW